MGKRKGSKKKGSQAGDEDASSLTSASTLSSVADLGFDDASATEDDPFEAAIDALYEKRATTRERGLESLVRLLTGSFAYEEAIVRRETLSTLMLGCIKKGSVVEAALACRGIALLLVTLGASDDAESLQSDAHPIFEQAACYGKTIAVKAAAIDALAITVFTASNDPAVVDKCMAGFANLWKSGPTKVKTAAIRGWALLLSTVPAWRMTANSVEQSLQSLAKELHSEDVEVRVAAGEAIALLYHSCGISDLDSFLENDQSDESPPTSPVSQGRNSHFQQSLGLSNSAQDQPAPPGSSSTPQGQGLDPHRVAANPATPSSAPVVFETQQADASEAVVKESETSPSNSAESDSDLRLGRVEHASSGHAARDEQSSAQAGSSCGNQVQSQAQPLHVSPQHAKQHSSDMSHDGTDHQAAHRQTEPSSSQNTAATGDDVTMSHLQATQPPTQIRNSVAEVASNSQQSRKNKAGHQKGSASGSRNPQQKAEAITNGLDDVVSRMRQLATNRGDNTRRSKKDRASTKATFRELYNVVEQDGVVSQIKIKLRHGDTLVVDTLVGTVQLNAFRRFLAEGFQIHLQQNPLLHQIFNFEPREERSERLTPLEKKLYRSPASAESKSRTQRRNHDRAATSAYKGAMISEDW